MIRRLLVAMLMLGTALAPAASFAAGLRVSGAWARATAPGASTGAAYLELHNDGSAADRLIGAECEVAASVMAHVTRLVDGVESMQDERLDVPAHGGVKLAPQGSHLMLMGLKAPLVAGTTFSLTLHFARAGTVRIAVPVLGASAVGPP